MKIKNTNILLIILNIVNHLGYYFRHALEDSLERAFVPGLAAVISFIDVRRNLAVMDGIGPMSDIWLQVFRQCPDLGLQVDPQTMVGT